VDEFSDTNSDNLESNSEVVSEITNPETNSDTTELTVEQRVRREKPSSRVRFTESSQPGFVMMGLEKIGLMYGNEVIVKDATFMVQTGERVGLVGPNGGGKV
jgi:ATPase subunit of ABC transporter with duplicated ATPase domains